jgi:hypothetical protein
MLRRVKREWVHSCWAPVHGRWSAWVKPVPFADMSMSDEATPAPLGPTPEWLQRDPFASLPSPVADEGQGRDRPDIVSAMSRS